MNEVVRRRRVCLIGIDGLRADLAIDEGLMPTLSSLAATGSRHRVRTEVPTMSGPSWASLLTGASYAEHGVLDNTFLGGRLAAFPDFLSRAYYADQTTTTFAAASWPPLVDPEELGPIIQERREQHRAGLHRVVVRDGETHGYERADADIAQHSLWALRHDCPDASFLYFCEADEAGHLTGAQSPEYRAAMLRVDAHLAQIVQCIRDRQATQHEDWLVAVTTDHGHLDAGGHGGGHDHERDAFLVALALHGQQPAWPEELHPTELTPLLLRELALRDL